MSAPTAFANVHSRRAPMCLDCKPASKDFCPEHCRFCNTVPRTCTKKEHRVATPIAALAVGPPVAAPVATSAPAAGMLLSSSAPSFVPKPSPYSSTVLPTGGAGDDDGGCDDDAEDDGFTAEELAVLNRVTNAEFDDAMDAELDDAMHAELDDADFANMAEFAAMDAELDDDASDDEASDV